MKVIPLLACLLIATGPALAIPYSFTPLPASFTATALNSVGQIAGLEQPASPGGTVLPALYDGGAITLLSPQSRSFSTTVTGINDAGDLVGVGVFRYTFPFAVFGDVDTGFAVPGNTSSGTTANGLNNLRQIVGSGLVFTPGEGSVLHGYIAMASTPKSGSTYTLLDVPGAVATDATGINDAGLVVGSFASTISAGDQQGFVFDAGTFTTINRPGAVSTLPVAINDAGVIAGTYADATGRQYGFTEAAGVFTDITGPDGAAFLPLDLNNLGQLIGTFGGTGPSYLATPQAAVPEPATAALLGGGLVILGALRKRRPTQGHDVGDR